MRKGKRLLALMLAFLMVFGTAPSTAFAGTTQVADSNVSNGSSFDFECSEYGTTEDAGIFEVKVVRSGDGSDEANVAFKIADFLSTYGEDYVVLDENNRALSKVYGEKPEISDFEVTKVDGTYTVELKEGYESGEDESSTATSSSTETQLVSAETGGGSDQSAEAADKDQTVSAQSDETASDAAEDSSESETSALKDAQAAYLGLPDGVTTEDMESESEEVLNDLQEYFVSAEGAEGTLHFKKGETEKTIRIKVLDNDKSNSSRIFMIALLGTDNKATEVAANATTYVTIEDDEEAEGAVFGLKGDLTLTPDSPEGVITITRTGNTDRFSEVFLTTTKGNLDAGDFTSMENESVLFLPGETSKIVTVEAKSFDEDGYFGVRLETDGNTDNPDSIDSEKYRLSVNVKTNAEADDAQAENISILNMNWLTDYTTNIVSSSSDTLGDMIQYHGINYGNGGWVKDISGSDDDNCAYVDTNNNRLVVKNYDDGKYSCLGSENTMNLTGVKQLSGYMDLTDSQKSHYTTYLRVGSGNKYNSPVSAEFSKSGSFEDWGYVDTSSLNGDYYLRFAVHTNDWGFHNPKGYLENIRTHWAKYTFSFQDSAESFTRKIYDFSAGTPAIYQTNYEDGTTEYNPGSVSAEYIDAGTTKLSIIDVKGFYANAEKTVSIGADSTKNGYYLKGVYFANASKDKNSMIAKGVYTNDDVYYVAADSNGIVSVTLGQDFLSKLIDKGVVSSQNCDEEIKVFPVFGQDTVTVTFKNADRPEGNTSYDKTNLYSHFANILEAKLESKTVDGVTCYSIDVPKGTVIRLKNVPDSSRVASGVNYCTTGTSNMTNTYYKAGETRYGGQGKTVEITKDDLTMAEIVADSDITVVPATGEQTLYVGYSPRDKGTDSGVPSDLTNILNQISDGNIENTSDSDGSIYLSDVFIGENILLSVIAPSGYYTMWTNMTGDVNNDGIIDDEESEKVSDEDIKASSNPQYVFGSNLNLILDMDNTRYCYKFIKSSTNVYGTISGNVRREDNTFYNLANNMSTSSYKPVAGVYVDAAGFKGMTDLDGYYNIPYNAPFTSGAISTAVYINDQTYTATTSLERSSTITIPALEKFKAEKLSATYASKGAISGKTITAYNDELTITATISSSTSVTPADAQFFIYDKDGNERLVCEGERFLVGTKYSGDKFIATLKFNPKDDISNLDKIYVRFCDTNGHWYEPIDLGYTFYAEITLDKFIFPMLGCTTLDDIITGDSIVTDLIGNPLGGISLGTISVFDTETTDYTPSGVPEDEADDYTWNKTSYSFGWSKSFGTLVAKTLYNSKDSAGNDKDTTDEDASEDESSSEADKADVIDEAGKGDKGDTPSDSKYSTKVNLKWNVTPSVGFNLTLSNRQDGKTYFEDLTFYVGCSFGVTVKQTITLPIGISVLLGVTLDGSVKGIYYMYNEYNDAYETLGATEYTSEDFGLFKSFTNNVRREGYIFLDPAIRFKLGVGVGVLFIDGKADFIFDMDFNFTEAGVRSYGTMDIDLGFAIELFSFEVYSKTLYSKNVKLFNSEGVNEHIDLDTSTGQLDVNDYLKVDSEDISLNTPTSRAYLSNRTEWLENPFALDSDKAALMSVDTSVGTTAYVLRQGTVKNIQSKMFSIDDEGTMLLVYLDDDTSRSDLNKNAVYYSTGKDGKWTKPVLLEDDGTLDGYLYAADLGNGQIFVGWTTTDSELQDGDGLNEALSNANIHFSIFDKETEKFGEITKVTKQTDEDISANFLNSASYSKVSDRIMIYYSKYEYGTINSWNDIASERGALAYMYYDVEKGEMLDGSSYTDAEKSTLKASVKSVDTYAEQWYGQRFFNLKSSADYLPESLVYTGFDSDVLHLNDKDYVVSAWTSDMDGDQENTTDDRYIMCMVLNENDVTEHMVLQLNKDQGFYCNPKICVDGENVYLFYGTADEDGENTRIEYVNITSICMNQQYTGKKVGDVYYAEAKYTSESEKVEQWVAPQVAVEAEDVESFDVVKNESTVALIWTEADNSGRNIMASLYYGDEDYNDDEKAGSSADSDETVSTGEWSEAFQITEAEENIYYTGINPVISGGKLYISAGRANYSDEADTAFVLLKHTPYSKEEVTDLTVSGDNRSPGDLVKLTATIQNTGMLPMEKTVSLTFSNGKTSQKKTVKVQLSGGSKTTVSVDMEVPESNPAKFTVSDTSGSRQTAEFEREADVTASKQIIGDHPDADDTYVYTGEIANNGSADSGKVTVKAFVGDTLVGSQELGVIGYGRTEDASMNLSIPDNLFTEVEGYLVAAVTVKVYDGNEVVSTYSNQLVKESVNEAVQLLKKVTGVNKDSVYYVNEGDLTTVQPEITGVDSGKATVEWISSSDPSVAKIDYSNGILGKKAGTVTLKGIVVPNYDEYTFDTSGNSVKAQWKDIIPEKYQIPVEVTVTVEAADPDNPFSDVVKGKWYYDAVKYNYANGIMNGLSENTFGPDGKVSRAMLVTVLYRLEGQPETGSAQFTDVASDKYYAKAVAWASENGIVKGMSETTFAPDASITREQAAAMLYRYGQYKKFENIDAEADLSGFTDKSEISEYAKDAMSWNVAASLIKGVSDTSLDPKGNTTRAQLAALMQRLCETYKLIEKADEE